jgi:2-polyprenyl-3-methyl-5-hydroxy-6-metoxy-1,4-benzoquinol methylase
MLIPPDYGRSSPRNELMLTQLSEIYSRFGAPHKFRPCQPYANEYTWALNKIRCHLASRLRGSKIVELGGAAGASQWWLAQRGVHVMNITPKRTGPPPIHQGQPPLPPVEFQAEEFSQASLLPEHFDVVLALSSLEHNHPHALPAIFTQVGKCLRPDGLFIATFPVGSYGDWYPAGQWAECPKAKSTLVYDETLVRQWLEPAAVIAGMAIRSSYLERSVSWIERIAQAREVVRRTPGAVRLPYLSGGLVFEKRKSQ